SRALEGMAIIMKDSEPCRIQRALRSLDLERSNCLKFENSKEPSLRSMMYGLIESLHLALTHLTREKIDVNGESLAISEEWKRKV
ncbi:hypothetical protein PMAYCL1PPCAC_27407, partial [Pristionchus mayeri]